MAAPFDAMHKWLGIPPAQQPPNAYQLLGTQPFETDPDVISMAADQRMFYLRSFIPGPNAPHAENLLNQVAAARLCLLNPQQKQAYDGSLNNQRGKPSADGTPPKPPVVAATSSKGDLFGAFVIMERIGGGRSGPIFRAKERKTGTEVSLKILPAELAESKQVLKRFERETEIMSSLRHPNLVKALGAGQQDGIHFLVLEHLDALDLAKLVERHGPLPADKAVEFVVQAARGLGYLHINGVVHRNVKPHNLMLDRTGVLKISNLTVAHLAETSQQVGGAQEELTKQGDLLGSVDYLAPEQAADASNVDSRADIYSLGCTLHYLLTGRPPYAGKSMMERVVAHRSKPVPSLAGQVADVSPQLDQALTRMLAKQPTDRFGSMDEVISALENKAAAASLFQQNRVWLFAAAGLAIGVLVTLLVSKLLH